MYKILSIAFAGIASVSVGFNYVLYQHRGAGNVEQIAKLQKEKERLHNAYTSVNSFNTQLINENTVLLSELDAYRKKLARMDAMYQSMQQSRSIEFDDSQRRLQHIEMMMMDSGR